MHRNKLVYIRTKHHHCKVYYLKELVRELVIIKVGLPMKYGALSEGKKELIRVDKILY